MRYKIASVDCLNSLILSGKLLKNSSSEFKTLLQPIYNLNKIFLKKFQFVRKIPGK